MLDGTTVTADEGLQVISLAESAWFAAACRLRRYIERLQRIPPYLIFDRAGPDPAPFDLRAELHGALAEFDKIVETVSQLPAQNVVVQAPAARLPNG